MTIDWLQFAPWPALAGGVLIGVAASMLLLFNGRIAGISGILGGLLRSPDSDWGWRLAFIAGLVVAPGCYRLFAELPLVTVSAETPVLIIAGLLVGLGTRYGSGCTSGHGICGLARLSRRSLIATLTFMSAGFATVYVARHLF